jgi:hypothetical protein
MKLFSQLCRSAALLVPVLVMLFGTSIARGEGVQVFQSWKLSTNDGKLLFLDFEQDNFSVDNAGEKDGVQRDFVDIAYVGIGLDLLAIEGDELWVYFGGVYPEAPDPLPDPDPSAPKIILQAGEIGLRSLATVATDPFAQVPTALIIGQAKGKPVFQAYLCTFDFEPEEPTYDCGFIAKEFPRPVASAYIPVDATDALDGDGGFVVTGGTEVVALLANDNYVPKTVFKKQGVLNGGERITDIAYFADNELLVATNDRRVLQVHTATEGGNDFTAWTLDGVAADDPCLANRDQRLTVDVTEDEGEMLVMVADFACSEATLYKGDETSLRTVEFKLETEPGSGVFDYLMPEAGTVTDGEFLDLNGCLKAGGCPFDNEGAASVTVQKVEGSANATKYFVENMVDCRCNDTCEDPDIDITVGSNGEVNWIEFLPEEVHNLVVDPTWIPGYLEGSPARDCKLKAFIIKTAGDTRTGITEGDWDIGSLFDEPDDPPHDPDVIDLETQCETGLRRSDDPDVDNIVGPGWDVVIYSPTRGQGVCPDCDIPGVGDPTVGLDSMLASPGCSSTRVRTRSKSIFGVGFTVVPIDDQMPGAGVTDQLITDLGTAISGLAMQYLLPDDYATLSGRYTTQVLEKWETAKAKFTQQPNAADTALTALTSQLRKLQSDNASVTYADNPDNIQGDVETRIDMLLFFIDERLRQLVPLGGYPTL